MSKFILVTTTVSKEKEAIEIAEKLSKKKLSACSQIIGPIKSIYNWKGKLEKTTEYLILIKTAQTKFKAVEKEIKNIHPYELPEIIFIPISGGSKNYLNWLNKESR